MRYSSSSWSPETSSTIALVLYALLYSALTAACFLFWFFVAHHSISLPVRIILALFIGGIFGGQAFGCIAFECIAELIRRWRR